MIKKNVIIVGAGQMGELVSNIILRQGKFNILGFIDKKKKTKINDYKILGDDNFLFNKKIDCSHIVIAVTEFKSRLDIYKKLSKLNYKFPNIIDPSVKIDNNVRFREGVIIGMNSVILNRVSIGNLSIIGTSVNILHDCKIGNNCLIGGGTVVGANVVLKNNIYVGVGSVFASKKIIVGNDCFVSSGSVVLKSLKQKSKVIGNPAKIISLNE